MASSIRRLRCFAGVIVGVGLAFAATAQFPSRPVRVMVPSTPGSGPDVLARSIGAKLAERWGQPVVIENRPGATGLIGSEQVVRAPADGHTLLIVANSYATNPALYRSMPFDADRDLAPIAQLALGGMALVVHPTVPAQTVQELIAYARSRPGLAYGSAGQGSTHHMMMELFRSAAGLEMQHIPYKGPGPVTTDLLSGQIPVAFITVATALPHVRERRLRALAVAGERRFSVAQEVPTVAEAGLRGVEPNLWYGMLAPAATPTELIQRINADVVATLGLGELKEFFAKQGIEAAPSTPEQFRAVIRNDIARYIKLVRDVGIQPE